jgi:hypothetical protein
MEEMFKRLQEYVLPILTFAFETRLILPFSVSRNAFLTLTWVTISPSASISACSHDYWTDSLRCRASFDKRWYSSRLVIDKKNRDMLTDEGLFPFIPVLATY